MTIETARLVLRPHVLSDFSDLHRLWTNPGVYEPILGRPSTEAESWARLLKYAGLWSLLGYGYFALFDRSTKQYMGEVGLADFYRELEPSIRGLPEMGWVLHPDFHRQGYMKEAIEGVLMWAQQTLAFEKIVCVIDPSNEPSLRLAARCGFTEASQARLGGKSTGLFHRSLGPFE